MPPFTQEQYLRTHFSVLAALFLFGIACIWIGRQLKTDADRRRFRLALAILILVSRVIRYPIDASVGAFTWDGVFSLHVCHINLILLLICLVKPDDFLFNYCFLVGIPMGLASGLFPGDVTLDVPLVLLRGSLFVVTHLLMVIGAVYLAVVEKMKPSWKRLGQLYLVTSVQAILTYGANRLFGTNFLYIMTPVEGTPMIALNNLFGWPGYALAMVAITFILMALMKIIYDLGAWFLEMHHKRSY